MKKVLNPRTQDRHKISDEFQILRYCTLSGGPKSDSPLSTNKSPYLTFIFVSPNLSLKHSNENKVCKP